MSQASRPAEPWPPNHGVGSDCSDESDGFFYQPAAQQKWFRNFAQGDKWNFCLTAGTLVPTNQERP